MIAIGSNIGTGLFIGTGAALKTGGPAALLIAFLSISVVLYLMMDPLTGTSHSVSIKNTFNTVKWSESIALCIFV